tara:strand:+ start:197 stop:1234 length:1038 start_codon:yes stop_codon:yes gene_type:complete
MKTEIIKAEDYGLETKKGDELTVGLSVVKTEREVLIQEFTEVSKLELTKENLSIFKGLRLRISKNRTQGINKWHKTNKEFFLTGGRFVDAIKNKEVLINEQMEEKLFAAENHFIEIENKRVKELQENRALELSEFVSDAYERDLSGMESDVWAAYLNTKKAEYEALVAKEKKEEDERIEKEKAEEAKRAEFEKARVLEEERIRKENEKLRKEAEEKAKIEAIEKEKRDEIEKERQIEAEKKQKEYHDKVLAMEQEKAKIEADAENERKRIQEKLEAKESEEKIKIKEAEEKAQNELKKGDSEKFKDLLNDLETLKTKYEFKSKVNIKNYQDVTLLIDKIINHINQ